jgi:hypothetical protein
LNSAEGEIPDRTKKESGGNDLVILIRQGGVKAPRKEVFIKVAEMVEDEEFKWRVLGKSNCSL